MIYITDQNAFYLRVTAQTKAGSQMADVDLSVIKWLVAQFVRRGRSLQSMEIDSQGRAVIFNSGDLAMGVYGVEFNGYYNGQPWRFFEKKVFAIVDQTVNAVEQSGEINGIPVFDVTLTITLGGEGVPESYVTNAINEHDNDMNAHPYLQELIENAGKVDDVKVNGLSVVDENKEANINITATIDGNVGVPEVDVEQEDGEIRFAFKNMKGDKGETGATGPQGIPGEGAIWNGQAEVLTELEQTTGQAINKTMSQKGITDAIDSNVEGLREDTEYLIPIDRRPFGTREGWINTTTFLFEIPSSSGTRRRYRMFPAIPGATYQMTAQSNRPLVIAFLKSDTMTEGEAPDFVTGGSLIITPQGETRYFTAPEDATCMYMQWMTGGSTNDYAVGQRMVVKANDAVKAFAGGEQDYYIPIKATNTWNSKTISESGPTDTNPDYNYQLKRFVIDPTKEYYATGHVGASQTGYSVRYFSGDEVYDEESVEEFVGNDISFGPRQANSGGGFYDKVRLTVPADANIVYVRGKMHYKSEPWVPQLFEKRNLRFLDVTPHTIEYHTVTVNKPVLPPNSTYVHVEEEGVRVNEFVNEPITAGWAVMWPNMYAKEGTPTQVVAMLHGADGWVNGSVMGYPTDTTEHGWWKIWRDQYLSMGYAVMDINGVGETSGTTWGSADSHSRHYGGPVAIEVLDKAFDYLRENYNVKDKLLIHGTSMGGGLAQTYTRVHPNKVIAVALVAPIVLMRSGTAYIGGTGDYSTASPLSLAFGYETAQDMIDDDFKNLAGYVPCWKCMGFEDGVLKEMDWVAKGKPWDTLHNEGYDFKLIEHFPVPVRCWHGTADPTVPAWASEIIIEAYQRGGSIASIRLVQGADHDDMVFGNVDNRAKAMKAEILAWFRRFADY